MALKIKKVILNDKGQVVEELEGTESEVESYMKKRQKKEETIQKEQAKKKGILLGKEMLAKIQEMIDAAITKHALHNHLNLQPIRTIEHHWYHNNGWWYQPRYGTDGAFITYCATNKDPNVYGTANAINCSSVEELSAKTGIGADTITTAKAIAGGELKWSTNMSSANSAAYGVAQSSLTSGMINMNIKS